MTDCYVPISFFGGKRIHTTFQGHCNRDSLVGSHHIVDERSPLAKKCLHCGVHVGWKHASFCGGFRILTCTCSMDGVGPFHGCDTGSWWQLRCAASVTFEWPSVELQASRCDSSHQLGLAIRLQKAQDTWCQNFFFLVSFEKPTQFCLGNSGNFK